jgi:DNA-binding transcriptional LysR family regulator
MLFNTVYKVPSVTLVVQIRKAVNEPFGWLDDKSIRSELEQGLLKPLPLKHGSRKYADYLVITDAEGAGPATRALAGYIRQQVEDSCTKSL